MQQAEDFRDESAALHDLLRGADAARFDDPTQFKGWSINTVLQHLHFWNEMASYQILNEAKLVSTLSEIAEFDGGMRGFEAARFDGLAGNALLGAWWTGVEETATAFQSCDPKARLKWAGPDMSARSSITARLMETWAHGQEVYDHLGVVRQNADRIQNIVVLGVNTYGWTYKVRGETPPGPMPRLRLTAPSGGIWTYGEESAENCITGLAEEFCQVITQTRNVADTELRMTGEVARDWMSKAQCFAGAAHPPPAPGTRKSRKLAK